MERDRLRRVFSQGLDQIVGYALPLERDDTEPRWRTGAWLLRERPHVPLPGRLRDGLSPAARLASLGERGRPSSGDPAGPERIVPAAARVRRAARPRRAHRASCPARPMPSAPRPPFRRPPSPWTDPPARFESATGTVRTALCVEPRDGTLYVFMPPVAALEDYLELVAAVEATAAALSIPVLLEGYPPPSDPRLACFMITPDPGVIEVNVQPSESWDELVDLTTTVYEEARQTALTTDKFLLDGRHTGTGGGNHFVLGGPTAADSPFLRRPDLLASLVGYWHNHPSLSYLFSGLFVGPDQPGPARRRGAQRQPLRARDRLPPAPRARRADAAVAGGPPLPQPPGRRHRQYPSGRVLHRQDVRRRHGGRAARAARDARLRDAAACADEPRRAAPAARARRRLLARAVRDEAGAVGHGAARPVHAPLFHLARLRGRARRSPLCGLCLRARVVRPAPRVPLPGLRRRDARARCT